MTEETNVVRFKPDLSAERDLVSGIKIPPDPNAQSMSGAMLSSPAAGETPCEPAPCLPEVGDLGFEDMEAAFNMRDWLQKACEAAGGKMTGGGFGGGCADIWIALEGHEYMVSIKPVRT